MSNERNPPSFPMQQIVRWSGRIRETTWSKVGHVAEIVHAGHIPDRDRFPELFKGTQWPRPRPQESYVIKTKLRAYWPRASALSAITMAFVPQAAMIPVTPLGDVPTQINAPIVLAVQTDVLDARWEVVLIPKGTTLEGRITQEPDGHGRFRVELRRLIRDGAVLPCQFPDGLADGTTGGVGITAGHFSRQPAPGCGWGVIGNGSAPGVAPLVLVLGANAFLKPIAPA